MSADIPLYIRDLTVAYPGQTTPALQNVNWQTKPGTLTAIIGPNGAGKSTMLKAAMGLLPASTGETFFFGHPLEKVRRRIAYMPQRSSVDWSFPVSALDVAAMGLYGQIGWLRRVKQEHKAQAMEALDKVGMADLAHRQIGALSGGQQQRVFFARALAQNPDLYLMDEPFAGVDITTQNILMDLLGSLKADSKTIIVVHHDLMTVGSFFDEAILLSGEIVAHGPVDEVMTEDNLARAYRSPVVSIRKTA